MLWPARAGDTLATTWMKTKMTEKVTALRGNERLVFCLGSGGSIYCH